MKSGTFAPGKQQCRVLDAPVHRPVERQNPQPGISGKCLIVAPWQENCRDSICPIHFDTWLDKMDFSAAINKLLFKRYVQI